MFPENFLKFHSHKYRNRKMTYLAVALADNHFNLECIQWMNSDDKKAMDDWRWQQSLSFWYFRVNLKKLKYAQTSLLTKNGHKICTTEIIGGLELTPYWVLGNVNTYNQKQSSRAVL